MSAQDHGLLMDSVYRRQRFIYDLTRKYYLLGRDRLIDELDVPSGGHVLEIACGTGRNLRLIATRYPGASLYGLDISSEMLTSAQAGLARAGMAGRIRLRQADACSFAPDALFGRPGFERVVMSYCLSMIPDWRGALAEAGRALLPGGQLSVIDFGQQRDLPDWFGSALNGWLGRFHVTTRAELGDELQALAGRIGGKAEIRSLYRDYAVLATVTRRA